MLMGKDLDNKLFGYIVEAKALGLQRTKASAIFAMEQYGVSAAEVEESVERLYVAGKITVGPEDKLGWLQRAFPSAAQRGPAS